MKIFKLGVIVGDSVSGTEGMLTHFCIDMDESQKYIYQPRGLNPKTKKPVDSIMIDTKRVVSDEYDEIEIPLHILGTQAEDIATGFTGTIVGITYHLNGCLHIEVKPKGILEETGETIATCDFDIRRMKGEFIVPLGVEELKKDIKKKPSPIHIKSGMGK